jgi:2-polyprenyl-3-methyl-5-hydroxy-6-metoxy-1,4-benzoquinol methylase
MMLLLPESRPGFGSGHARRSFEVAQVLDSLGVSVYLGAIEEDRHQRLREILSGAFGDDEIDRFVPPNPVSFATADVSAVVFDSPKVDRNLVRTARKGSLTVGIDAGGPGRRECDYLIDALPRLAERVSPNVASTDYLKMPSRRRRAPGLRAGDRSAGTRPILVSFGGEDSRGLTARCLDFLVGQGVEPEKIAVTFPGTKGGRQGRGGTPMPGVAVLSSPGGLREELFRYDIVITAFGLTAFEALGAGAEVLLMHPTRYHRRLALRHGFVSLRSAEGRQTLRRGARDPERDDSELAAVKAPDWLLPRELARICSLGDAGKLGVGSGAGPVTCPVCGETQNPILARSADRTHYRCRECTMVFARRFAESGIDYDGSYFFEEYRAQYGRSYVEDLPAITDRGRDRLTFLEAKGGFRPPKGALDLGCAFGAFLQVLADRGYSAYGVDVSPEAVAYCRSQGFENVWSGDLRLLSEARPFDRKSFDLVSLWFVIEHFPDLREVLELLTTLVEAPSSKPGGLLAFSTPNLTGISGIRDQKRFLTASPGDHATVWSPRIARRVLRRFGFAVVATRVTGHHPERFPGAAGVRPGGLRWKFLLVLSKLFRLGDTFEVLSRRKRGSDYAR